MTFAYVEISFTEENRVAGSDWGSALSGQKPELRYEKNNKVRVFEDGEEKIIETTYRELSFRIDDRKGGIIWGTPLGGRDPDKRYQRIDTYRVFEDGFENQMTFSYSEIAFTEEDRPGEIKWGSALSGQNPKRRYQEIGTFRMFEDGEEKKIRSSYVELPVTPPTAVEDVAETSEDLAVTINVLGNDSDMHGNPPVIESFAQGANGTVTQGASGELIYTPNENWSGTDTFTYMIKDTDDQTAMATVTVTVSPVIVPATGTDHVVRIGPHFNSVFINFTDPNQPLIQNPDHEPNVRVETFGPASANLTVTCVSTFCTATIRDMSSTREQFSYRVVTGEEGNEKYSPQYQVTMLISQLPAVQDDEATVNQGSEVAINVLANDRDPNGGSLTIISVDQPENGTLVLNNNGTITYKPHANFHGEDSFTYTVRNSENYEAVATVKVYVEKAPEPPTVRQDGRLATDEDKPKNFIMRPETCCEDDKGVENLTIIPESFVSSNGGTIVFGANGEYTYQPRLNFDGTDIITFTVKDSDGLTASGRIVVTVSPVNDAPQITAAFSEHTTNDQAVRVDLNGSATDVEDGSNLTYQTTFSGASIQGTVLTFTPPSSALPGTTYDVAFEACDTGGKCTTGYVNITIDDRPVVQVNAEDDNNTVIVTQNLINPTLADIDVQLNVTENDLPGSNKLISDYIVSTGGALPCPIPGKCAWRVDSYGQWFFVFKAEGVPIQSLPDELSFGYTLKLKGEAESDTANVKIIFDKTQLKDASDLLAAKISSFEQTVSEDGNSVRLSGTLADYDSSKHRAMVCYNGSDCSDIVVAESGVAESNFSVVFTSANAPTNVPLNFEVRIVKAGDPTLTALSSVSAQEPVVIGQRPDPLKSYRDPSKLGTGEELNAPYFVSQFFLGKWDKAIVLAAIQKEAVDTVAYLRRVGGRIAASLENGSYNRNKDSLVNSTDVSALISLIKKINELMKPLQFVVNKPEITYDLGDPQPNAPTKTIFTIAEDQMPAMPAGFVIQPGDKMRATMKIYKKGDRSKVIMEIPETDLVNGRVEVLGLANGQEYEYDLTLNYYQFNNLRITGTYKGEVSSFGISNLRYENGQLKAKIVGYKAGLVQYWTVSNQQEYYPETNISVSFFGRDPYAKDSQYYYIQGDEIIFAANIVPVEGFYDFTVRMERLVLTANSNSPRNAPFYKDLGTSKIRFAAPATTPTVSVPVVTNLSTTSVRLDMDGLNLTKDMEVVVAYRPNGAFAATLVAAQDMGNGKLSVTLSNLKEGTTYPYQVFIRRKNAGNYAYVSYPIFNPRSFTTTAPDPTPIIDADHNNRITASEFVMAVKNSKISLYQAQQFLASVKTNSKIAPAERAVILAYALMAGTDLKLTAPEKNQSLTEMRTYKSQYPPVNGLYLYFFMYDFNGDMKLTDADFNIAANLPPSFIS